MVFIAGECGRSATCEEPRQKERRKSKQQRQGGHHGKLSRMAPGSTPLFVSDRKNNRQPSTAGSARPTWPT